MLLIVLRVIGFFIGACMLLTSPVWSGWFIVGLVLAGICGLSFLPDLLDAANIDIF